MSKMSESGAESGISPAKGEREEPRWWESAEDHRFALVVLQLRIRRDILKFIDEEIRSAEEVAKEFGINEGRAAFHLAMLEKALVVERVIGGYKSTLVGLLYIKEVDDR